MRRYKEVVPVVQERSTSNRHIVSVARRSVASGAVAVAANVALWGSGKAADASFVVDNGSSSSEVTLALVALSTAVSFAFGAFVVAVAGRRSRRAAQGLIVAGVAFALLSVGGPLSADTDNATRGLLALMHLVTGAAFVAALISTYGASRVTHDDAASTPAAAR